MANKATMFLTAPAAAALIVAVGLNLYLYRQHGHLDLALLVSAIAAAIALTFNRLGTVLWSKEVARSALSDPGVNRTVVVDDARMDANVPRATRVLYMFVPLGILIAWIALLVGVVRLFLTA